MPVALLGPPRFGGSEKSFDAAVASGGVDKDQSWTFGKHGGHRAL